RYMCDTRRALHERRCVAQSVVSRSQRESKKGFFVSEPFYRSGKDGTNRSKLMVRIYAQLG
ncbi:hypothetical protein SB861_66835, partial [Paraburkholderia sp. SIMBA_049]